MICPRTSLSEGCGSFLLASSLSKLMTKPEYALIKSQKHHKTRPLAIPSCLIRKISNIEKKSIKVGGTQIDPNLALCLIVMLQESY